MEGRGATSPAPARRKRIVRVTLAKWDSAVHGMSSVRVNFEVSRRRSRGKRVEVDSRQSAITLSTLVR